MVDWPHVSVVIPSHNRVKLLSRCLEAMERYLPAEVELIVVDDGSVDETRALLEGSQQVNLLIHNPIALGPAAARNRGWRAARGRLIAFTDDDCIIHPGWLEALSAQLERASEKVAGVGGRVDAATSGLISSYMVTHCILEPPSSLNYLVTANCIFRREALEQVGGFNETIAQPGGEDPGLCFELRKYGWRFERCNDAIVSHHFRESGWDFLKTFYRYGKGCRIVLDS